jgi:hypothetical protein
MSVRARFRPPRPALVAVLAALLTGVLIATGPEASAPEARSEVCTGTDPIVVHYCELGGAASVLGSPVGAAYAVGAGRGQDYTAGSIYWTVATGAREVHGPIASRSRYAGGPLGRLGFPMSDQRTAADGVGAYNHFQGGSIFWSPATGAHEVHGVLRARWAQLGWERSPLGYPISDEYAVNGGGQSDFVGGFLRRDTATDAVRMALLAPYQGAGTWITRYRFSREFGGADAPTTPADVDAMAAAGVRTIYIQAAADDPRYLGLLSSDLLGRFLTRAHARGMKVVAWYLPHLTDVPADLRRLQAMVAFRASGQGFDAVGVDIEDLTVADVDARNARLVDLSARLYAAAPGTTLSAIVLPPVVTDVLNPAYWPRFPWRTLSRYYQVWMPMAYWSNRSDPAWSDPYRYITENISRVRAALGERCAAVSVVGGYGVEVPTAAYAAMARAARDRGAIGVSVFDWETTPGPSWVPLAGYPTRGC